MERVLETLPRLSKRKRRAQSVALLKVLSRHWNHLYAGKLSIPAFHQRRVNSRGIVTASWLCKLRELAWVAVGNGELVTSASAVIRTSRTEALYSTEYFVCDLDEEDLDSGLAAELRLITDIRASDLLAHLERIRDEEEEFEHARVLQAYRTLGRLCSADLGRVGDLWAHDLQTRFSKGKGLVSIKPGDWKRPDELFSGKDVFHEPDLFVPNALGMNDLWRVLGIRPPDLRACILQCRRLAENPHNAATEAVLIDLYRFMEPLIAEADRRQKERLRALALVCFGQWVDGRPVYYVEDRELRAALARALPSQSFWTPPCDVTELPRLTAALGLITPDPILKLRSDRAQAMEAGEHAKPAFQRSVEQLSNELARNDASTREQLAVTWDALRDLPLFVYEQPFSVDVRELNFGAGMVVQVKMKALLTSDPKELHVWIDALQQRDNCGRAIASLFPRQARWTIENAWVASWIASKEAEAQVEVMRFASDETHAEELAKLSEKLADGKKGKVKVTPAASRASGGKPRALKAFQPGVSEVSIHQGSPAAPPPPVQSKPLVSTPPLSSSTSNGGQSAAVPVHYSTADLEQRGWEILTHVLTRSDAPELVDFRERHGVGADGAMDWKTFVELKATGRGPQSSIDMTNSEYERAKERGLDFVLALVSGLEEDQRTEVRLILDPAHRVATRPLAGIRLVSLADAPAVVIRLDDGDGATGNSEIE